MRSTVVLCRMVLCTTLDDQISLFLFMKVLGESSDKSITSHGTGVESFYRHTSGDVTPAELLVAFTYLDLNYFSSLRCENRCR